MFLHDELLGLAFALSASTKQAYRRRSISTAYYALFHRLAHDSATLFFPSTRDEPVFTATIRALDHRTMLNVSQGFAGLAVPKGPVRQLMDSVTIPDELRQVSRCFVKLQRVRHRADYDVSARFSATDAKDRCFEVKLAFADLDLCRSDPAFRLFLACLLFANSWRS